MAKDRIDKLLVRLGLADSRTKARALIMAGAVLADERRVDKPSEAVDEDTVIRLKAGASANRYVGRGGIKLEKALDIFHICPHAYVCLDIGASTGGFTDCLLQHGAASVYAVDAGTNQLDWKLRRDVRVVVMEKTNARYLDTVELPVMFDLATIDVSFISVEKILGPILPHLKESAEIVVLVKPQFEVGKGQVGKGGVVRDPDLHAAVIEKLRGVAHSHGLSVAAVTESPILGAAGNKEFLMLLRIGSGDNG